MDRPNTFESALRDLTGYEQTGKRLFSRLALSVPLADRNRRRPVRILRSDYARNKSTGQLSVANTTKKPPVTVVRHVSLVFAHEREGVPIYQSTG